MQDHKQVFSGSPFEGMAVKNILEITKLKSLKLIPPWLP